ncbi:MAG: hypothetical protein WBD22_14885 [Pyrinomonadaceae bacterium]
MKKSLLTLCFAATIALIMAASAQAQMSTEYRAQIPFDFTAGKSTHTSGDYTIGFVNPGSSLPALAIRNRETGKTKVLAIVNRSAEPTANSATMSFLRDGNQYTLLGLQSPMFDVKFKRTKTDVIEVSSAGANREIVMVNLIRK